MGGHGPGLGLLGFSPPDRKGWNPRLRCFYTTPPPSIPPEQFASGSRRASRQSGSPVGEPVDPARVSRQSSSPGDLAEYPAEYRRVARQWIPPIPAEYPLPAGSCRDPARAARQHSPGDPASSSPVWLCLMSRRADANLEPKSLGCGGICVTVVSS